MLSDIVRFVKRNQADIFWVAALAATALAAFALGRLTAPANLQNAAIIITNSDSATSTGQSAGIKASGYTGPVVASKNGTKYYKPDDPLVQRIAAKNLVKFTSEEEALKAGYQPNAKFGK